MVSCSLLLISVYSSHVMKKKPPLLSDTRSWTTWFTMIAIISFWINYYIIRCISLWIECSMMIRALNTQFCGLKTYDYKNIIHRETLNKTCNWNARQAVKPDFSRWTLADWDKIRMHNNKRNTNFLILLRSRLKLINNFFVNCLINLNPVISVDWICPVTKLHVFLWSLLT